MTLCRAGVKGTAAELRNVTIDDLPLFEQTHCDPVMMAELGGPLPRERLPARVRTVAAEVTADECWYFKIIPESETGVAAGTVCLWASEWQGEPLNEIGWMVLPAFQGRGIASEAVGKVLDRARSLERWNVIHAFLGVTNAPSNAICRKPGFANLGACDVDFAGRMLRCNHWPIDLREPDATEAESST